ncbi:acyl-CoA thioesterase domain-containing protein [Litorivivens sp.]|uniref:acyl-CoA thioesterase domain-containing protein n=1 Tax=Litorivivens sp. TaxID=2020868 RepID=UPI003565DA80
MTRTALDQLVDILRLEKLDENLYRGQSEVTDWGRVYGGQVIGQALSAAKQQVPEDREIHSLHAYFLRPGDSDLPIIFEVENTLDAGTISNRRIKAMQKGNPICFMTSSFQVPLPGFDHASTMPEVPAPETLETGLELFQDNIRRTPEDWLPKFSALKAIDFRLVEKQNILQPQRMAPRWHLWMRANGQLPNDQRIHQYALAYASDFLFLGAATQPHEVSFFTEGLRMATIDHSLWFHRPFDFNDWLLYAIDSPSASNGRGFVRGQIFNRAGQLVASTAQEGIMRFKATSSENS